MFSHRPSTLKRSYDLILSEFPSKGFMYFIFAHKKEIKY
jgi:hypothetical protein